MGNPALYTGEYNLIALQYDSQVCYKHQIFPFLIGWETFLLCGPHVYVLKPLVILGIYTVFFPVSWIKLVDLNWLIMLIIGIEDRYSKLFNVSL